LTMSIGSSSDALAITGTIHLIRQLSDWQVT
jgi:hypothetical protein